MMKKPGYQNKRNWIQINLKLRIGFIRTSLHEILGIELTIKQIRKLMRLEDKLVKTMLIDIKKGEKWNDERTWLPK